MFRPRQFAPVMLVAAVCSCAPLSAGNSDAASVRKVSVLEGQGQGTIEIEIESSGRVLPQALVLTGPDRLVLDFPNTTPSRALRSHSVNRGDVKSLRVGLFRSSPPTTRIVVDLAGPTPYQLFPQGKTVILKIGGGTAAQNAPAVPGLINASYTAGKAVPARSPLEVFFQNGLLTIRASRATLSEVLFAVHQRTGAEIAIPAGAEQEQVAANYGPAPAPEVLAHLLNGSKFNFLILNSAVDPRMLDKVILSLRPEGSYTPSPRAPSDDEDAVVSQVSPAKPPVRGNGDAAAPEPPQSYATAPAQDDASQPSNPTPPNQTFPNARPSEVKPPDQDNDSPDY